MDIRNKATRIDMFHPGIAVALPAVPTLLIRFDDRVADDLPAALPVAAE